VLAPAPAFVEQDLVHAAALHRNPFVLVQVGRSSVERPGGKGQSERLRPESPEHQGGQALLSQAAEGLVLCAQGRRDR
jgi:hypothetical protein